MEIEVISFGSIAEIAGKQFRVKDVRDTSSLKEVLEEMHPSLKSTKYAIAVDKKLVQSNTILDEHSVVALMPPFSGG